MPKEFIVAIELGSSKMTGIAGQKNLDGSITVLATVEEDSSSCIRKGVIYNIDKHHQEVEKYTETRYRPGLCRRGRSLYTQYQERHCQRSPR